MYLLVVAVVAILAAVGVTTALATPRDQCGVQFPCRNDSLASYQPTVVNLTGQTLAPTTFESTIHVYAYSNGMAPSSTGDVELQLSGDLSTAKAQAAAWLKDHPGFALGGYFRPNRPLMKPAP